MVDEQVTAGFEHQWPSDEWCGGLPAGCPECKAIWQRVAGGRVGLCVLCDTRHWPWEPHGDADSA